MKKTPLSIQIEEVLPYSTAKVWRALTDADLLARWLMPNDFKLELGHRFTFRTTPMPSVGFDGVIQCQVLAIEPERLLQISWCGGHGLESTLTWRLDPRGDGTGLRLDHTGFDPDDPAQRQAHAFMGSGWRSHVLDRLADCLDAMEIGPGG